MSNLELQRNYASLLNQIDEIYKIRKEMQEEMKERLINGRYSRRMETSEEL